MRASSASCSENRDWSPIRWPLVFQSLAAPAQISIESSWEKTVLVVRTGSGGRGASWPPVP